MSQQLAEKMETGQAMQSINLMPTSMSQAMQLAEMMAKGKMVPSHLQSSPSDCLMVIEQSARWGMSPFAVAQCTSVIKGRLMFEGKLVAAAIQNSGILDGRLNYDFKGEGRTREVTVSGTIRGQAGAKTITLKLKDAETDNDCWKKQPDQQLCYAGARVWARRWAPEVMLGVYSPEEDFSDTLQDIPHACGADTSGVEMPRAASAKVIDSTAERVAESQKQETTEIKAAPADQGKAPDTTGPRLAAGQIRILQARMKSVNVTDDDILVHFKLPLEKLAFSQFNDIQAWLKSKAA